MKKAIFLILIIIAVSCSKDEIDSPLVGRWEAISFITSEPVDENMDGIKNSDLAKELDCIAMTIDFSASGKISIETNEVTYEITTVDGEVVVLPNGCGPITEHGTFSLNDASTKLFVDFIVEGSNETTPVTIDISLSDNQLILHDLIYEENPNTITYTVELKKK